MAQVLSLATSHTARLRAPMVTSRSGAVATARPVTRPHVASTPAAALRSKNVGAFSRLSRGLASPAPCGHKTIVASIGQPETSTTSEESDLLDIDSTSYENTGHLQLLHDSYKKGQPEQRRAAPNQWGAISCEQLVGGTPLVDLSALSVNPTVKILAKAEYLNPSGSIKDRIAQHIIAQAIASGELKPGMTVVAATSGNTGSAIAAACATRGYPYIVITNEKTSKEKIDSMRAYGGEVIVAPSGLAPDHPEHYMNIETRLCAENPENYYGVDQYNNPYNAEAYAKTLGPEIWSQTGSRATHFVAGGSTGGTISGTASYLKDVNPAIRVVMADPKGSVFWDHLANGIPESELTASGWECEGVGKDSIPGCMDVSLVDGIIRVTDAMAFRLCRDVATSNGILLGGSAGLNLTAARRLSAEVEDGSVIVTIMPDAGVKYLSKIYNDQWIEDKGMGDAVLRAPHWTEAAGRSADEGEGASAVPPGTMHWCPNRLERLEKAESARADPDEAHLWSETQTESELKFLGELSAKLVDYHRESISGAAPVSKLNSPAELSYLFAEAGAKLELRGDDAPTSIAGLGDAVQAVMDHSVRSSHPLFLNQLYSGVDPVALAGEWMASTLNANVHTFEVAPVLTQIEKEVLAKTARLWLRSGDDETPSHEGLMVPGGSLSNLYSLLLARHKAAPEARESGAPSDLVAFCSEQSHYSFKKSALVAGLGMERMVKVPCDERGAMIPAELERLVKESKAAGLRPIYVGATAGSTVLGAYDPFDAVADVCAAHGCWLHIDGAWGGAAMLSEKHGSVMDGAERADSYCWNPHKMLGLPLQTSIFVCKGEGVLAAANAAKADYLFQPDKNNAGADLGDRTIQCGRKADSLKIWLAWKHRSDAGWGELVDRAFDFAADVEEMVRASDAFVLAQPAQCANVGFWYVPPRMRPFDPATASEDELVEIGYVAPKLKDRMQRSGDAMIGFQPVEYLGQPNFFRLVLPNPRHLSRADLRRMLERMDALGQEL